MLTAFLRACTVSCLYKPSFTIDSWDLSGTVFTRTFSNGKPVTKLVTGAHQIRRSNLGGAIRHRSLSKKASVCFLLEINLVIFYISILTNCSASRMQQVACSCQMTKTCWSHWNPCHWKGVHCRCLPTRVCPVRQRFLPSLVSPLWHLWKW